MSLTGVLVIALALATAAAFQIGQRSNRRLAAELTRVLEESLHPQTTSYTNIGGVVGYHLTYAMRPPWLRVEGTFTLSPRQALLYLPISRMLGREDTLRLTLWASRPPMGVGHVVDARLLSSLAADELADAERRTVEAGGRTFVVLAYNPQLAERLAALVREVPRPDCLRHLACSGPEESVHVVLRADPQALRLILPYLESSLLQLGSSL